MGENLIGLNTIDCARYIVARNSEIDGVNFRGYVYVPDKSSENDPMFPVSRDSFLNGFDPETLFDDLPEGANIALDSRISKDGEKAYFLMTDLAPFKSLENQKRIEERLREILVPQFGGGFLLETNRSYHYLGLEVGDFDIWLNFLGKCLITSIVTKTPDDQPNTHEVVADYRYIGHSILRRSTGLRVTTKGSKTFTPRSVAVIL